MIPDLEEVPAPRSAWSVERPARIGTNTSGDLKGTRPPWSGAQGGFQCPRRRNGEDARDQRYVTSFEPGCDAGIVRLRERVHARATAHPAGREDAGLPILSVTGRTTGKRYAIPVSVLDLDGSDNPDGEPVATGSRGGADVEVRAGRVTRRMPATLVEPQRVVDVYQRLLPAVGIRHAKRLGLVLAGNRAPTRDELLEIRRTAASDHARPALIPTTTTSACRSRAPSVAGAPNGLGLAVCVADAAVLAALSVRVAAVTMRVAA